MKHPLYHLILSFPVVPIISNPFFEECKDKKKCCVSETYKVEDLFYAVDQYGGIELCNECHNAMLYLCWKFDDAEYTKNGYVSYENSVDQYSKHIIKQKRIFRQNHQTKKNFRQDHHQEFTEVKQYLI